VTTSDIVADWVKAIGQDRVDVFSLLPPNTDPHTYQPGAQDIARVADADLVISVGLGLEAGWLNELVENAAQDPRLIIELGNEVDPIDFVGLTEDNEPDHEEGEETSSEAVGHEENGEEDHHEGLDPHFWFDPLRVKQAINSVAAQLSSVDPAGQTLYRDNAAVYSQELDDLHAWIEAEVELLPAKQRLLVTSHDSFQYFAQRYNFEIVGALMPTTTEVEPSAQDLAKLMETIEHSGAKAVFAEKSQTDRLSRQIAEDTGARLIGGLYTGSLGQPGGEAGTYLDFMRYNVSTIVEVLK
jgi:ABC-type Zn uptake system ZnuABC Zn-binding protein ZnuA